LNKMSGIKIRVFTVAGTLLALMTGSCEKEIHPPAIGKPVISKITVRSADVECKLIWDGGSQVTGSGFCWNTTGDPTIADSYVMAEISEGKFFCTIDSLVNGTRYYIRSFARNKESLSYGLAASFRTEPYRKPSVINGGIHGVTHNSIFVGLGKIEDNTGNIISKGACWSTSVNPTIDDHKVDLGGGAEAVNFAIEGLQPGTIYYLRCYATNPAGTSYTGNQVARTFDGSMTDYEGHVYYTVCLGSQEWMNRNLETCFYSNGDRIATTGTPTVNIEQEQQPAYQWAFLGHEEHPELLDDYGRLYTWYSATDSRKICPDGWHLPTRDEWNELIIHLGGDNLTSEYLRQNFHLSWNNPLNPGLEGSYWAQLAGFRLAAGQFQYGSYYGTYWWAATEVSPGVANVTYCGPSSIDAVAIAEKNKKDGYSVRCIRD
jgi:uncharacterized protein (TIGR02145 family)